jgi:hypothetical protein
VHAVPVQHSRAFLESVKDVLPPHVPIVCVSKGLEVGTGCMMSEVIPSALGRRQPATFISGPSFAREVMEGRPTGVVAASRDAKLARDVQQLFASPLMRVNTTTDVIGERGPLGWRRRTGAPPGSTCSCAGAGRAPKLQCGSCGAPARWTPAGLAPRPIVCGPPQLSSRSFASLHVTQ